MNIDNKTQVRVVEIIREWQKGCTNASDANPEDCNACTGGMVEAIYFAVKEAIDEGRSG